MNTVWHNSANQTRKQDPFVCKHITFCKRKSFNGEKKVLQINHRTNPRYEMSKNKTKVGNSHKKNIQVFEKKWKGTIFTER